MIRTRTIQATVDRVLWLGIGFILSFSRRTAGGGGGATTPSTMTFWPMWPTAAMRPQIMTLKHRVLIIMGGHGRRGLTRHSCGKQWPVLLQSAVATFGGATYAAKCEMRDLHSAASQHQVGELAEDDEPPEPMPEPVCSA